MSILPPRTTLATLDVIAPVSTWVADDGTNDPWVGAPYRWSVRLSVTPQAHSSHLTPTPYRYGAADVRVGDWFADFAGAKAVQIAAITAVEGAVLTAIVEDVERYNTFADPAGAGRGVGAGSGAIFALGLDGLPVIASLSGRSSGLAGNPAWSGDLAARFRYRNTAGSILSITQAGHGLQPGDLVGLSATGYARISELPAGSVVTGCVVGVGVPVAAAFDLLPVGRVLTSFAQDLPGAPGDLLYAGPAGLTSAAPIANARPLLQRLGARKAILLDRGIETAGSQGYSSHVYVAATPNDRDALAPLNPGDQVFVHDDGNGEWASYLYDADYGFIRTTTQDVSSTAPGRQNVLLGPTSPTNSEFARLAYGARIIDISVEVLEPFDGTATFRVVNANDGTVLLAPAETDLTVIGDYVGFPAYEYLAGGEASIQYNLDLNQTTAGLLRVSISYL